MLKYSFLPSIKGKICVYKEGPIYRKLMYIAPQYAEQHTSNFRSTALTGLKCEKVTREEDVSS